jgi:PAS domain S-box-containing protein
LIAPADQLKSDARFAVLADTMPQMVWSTLPDGFHDYYNARWYEFTGMPAGSTDGEAWNGMFHPDDQARAWARWRHSLATGEAYEIEYRLRHHSGEYRWTLGRALPLRDEHGAIVRWYGTCTDIHATKRLEQERTLVANELSHRIKNIFAVISGLIHLSARSFPEAKGFADALRERVGALGRAHDFVSPHGPRSHRSGAATSLFAMLAELLAAYQDEARIVFEGDDAAIDDRSATPLGLVFHELATNAAKYGALSAPAGRVVVASLRDGDQQVLTWTETGGPAVTAPKRTGFGSKLTRISVEGQLGGKLDYDWRPAGLVLTLILPSSALSR